MKKLFVLLILSTRFSVHLVHMTNELCYYFSIKVKMYLPGEVTYLLVKFAAR